MEIKKLSTTFQSLQDSSRSSRSPKTFFSHQNILFCNIQNKNVFVIFRIKTLFFLIFILLRSQSTAWLVWFSEGQFCNLSACRSEVVDNFRRQAAKSYDVHAVATSNEPGSFLGGGDRSRYRLSFVYDTAWGPSCRSRLWPRERAAQETNKYERTRNKLTNTPREKNTLTLTPLLTVFFRTPNEAFLRLREMDVQISHRCSAHGFEPHESELCQATNTRYWR